MCKITNRFGHKDLGTMKKLAGYFSVIGVVISLLYFSEFGIFSELVASEECPQLSDEFDFSPVFETHERLFMIDDHKMKQTNDIVYDRFVTTYNKYPADQIKPLLIQYNLHDKSRTNQGVRYIPDTDVLYNNTAKDLCKSNKTVIMPQAAEYESGWLVVINQPDFVQTIPVEVCLNKNALDSNLNKELLQKSDLNLNNLKCRQAVSKITLIVFVSNQLFGFEFEYDSACEPYSS